MFLNSHSNLNSLPDLEGSNYGFGKEEGEVPSVFEAHKVAKIDLDKRLGRVGRNEISKSSNSTSSESEFHVWKGECSRKSLSCGPRSLSLDQVIMARPRFAYNGPESICVKDHLEAMCRLSNIVHLPKESSSQPIALPLI
ncbi:hypothetical protein QYF36_024382 [Acer negundo]|nr:hypothetical protein QYF36_024382 [Acer negundo]